MRSKLEAHKDYQRMRGDYNMFLLVGGIKGLTFKLDGNMHLPHALHDANRQFYRYYQTVNTTKLQYLETFKNNISVIESYGGSIGTDQILDKEKLEGISNPKDPYKQAAAEAAKSKYLGFTMICGADQGRYGNLVEELKHDFT